MLLDDPALPAAPHLVGGEASVPLAAAVSAFGGRLEAARACELHHRPGRDLVARYDATVTWAGTSTSTRETLLASTTDEGVPHGTVPVEATLASGATISVGIWKWPFDPVLTGLTTAATPSRVAPFVARFVGGGFRLRVRAYRPTERAVVHVTGSGGRSVFVKVLSPDSVPEIADRHRLLHAAGVPVPEVLATDSEHGLIVMAALRGRTLREQLDRPGGRWPAPGAFAAVFRGFAATPLQSAEHVRTRASAALGHARMLRVVAPELASRFESLEEPLAQLAHRSMARVGPVIHGDLYDAQVVAGRGQITGVLDVDDAGPGDPIDDRATILGFLLVRALFSERTTRTALTTYAELLRSGFAEDVDRVELDHATAAVLVGLATGPFRGQRTGWRTDVERHLTAAAHVLGGDPYDTETIASPRSNTGRKESTHATS